ncbi:MAG: alpha/beta hydrolase [Rubripirellula sp.]|nr:alpha/beta hydrolase [Rubripirellula sp.]
MSHVNSESPGKRMTDNSDASKQLDDVHQQTGKPKRNRRVRGLLRVVSLFCVAYLMVLLLMVLMESRLVYPGAYVATDLPADNLATEPIQYFAADGSRLNGRLLTRAGCSNYLLFMHGNYSKAQWLDEWAARLGEAFDATVLLAEYRGYEDDLTPTEAGILEDCEAARKYLCDRFEKQKPDIILYGRSLGGGCAVALAANGGAKALILERTFDQLVGVASAQYPWAPIRLLMKNRFDSIGRIAGYTGPLVILHGTDDELVSIDCARRLNQAANCQHKLFIEVAGMKHNGNLPDQYLRQIVDAVTAFTSQSR